MVRWALGLVLVLAGCQTGSRAVVFDEASFAPSPGVARSVPSVAGVRVASETSRFTFDEGGRKTYRYTLRYRVEAEDAVERWGRFEVRWSPEEQDRPTLAARVESPDGTTLHLEPSAVIEHAAETEDQRRLVAELPGVDVGSVVERSVTYRDRGPPPLGYVSGRYALGLSVPVEASHVVFDAPVGFDVRYRPRGFRPRISERTVDGRRVTELIARELPAVWAREPLLLPELPRVPHVAFSSAPSWSAWGERWSQIVDPWLAEAARRGLAEAAVLGSRAGPGEVPTLVRRAHELVRWTSEPITSKPRPIDEILASGEGDALEKALVMSAMFEAAGIQARVGLSKRGLGEDVRPDFPDASVLDHALVYLPEADVFIDVTDRFVRPGHLPVPDQGRHVLLLGDGDGRLVRTPEATARDNRYREVRVLDLARTPELTFFEETTAAGAIEARLRDRFAGEGSNDVRRYLVDYLRSSYRGARLEDVQMANLANVDEAFSIQLAGRGGGLVQTEGSETTVFVSAPVLFTWLPKPVRDATLARRDGDSEQRFAAGLLATRTADLYVPEPYAATVRIDVRVPQSLEIGSAPASETIQLGPALYHQSVEKMEDGWRMDLGFVLDRRRLSAEEARALVGGLRELWSRPIPRLVLVDRAQRDLEAGRLADGLRRLHGDARGGGSAGPMRLASALLDERLGFAAHRWARVAVERNPEDPSTLAEASRILEHDELGERFGPGFPRDEAVALMRRARRVLRGAQDSNARLARLLSVNARGLPNHEPVELEEAIVLLSSFVDRSPTEESTELLGRLLFRVGRRAELVRRAEGWPRSLELDALRVAAWVQLDGVPTALDRASSLTLPDAVLAVVADRAARALVDVQDYGAAGTLLESVLDRAEDPDPLRQRARLYRRIGDGLSRSVVGPAEPVFRLHNLLADSEPGLDRMQNLFTDSAWARMDPVESLGDLARATEWAHKRAWEAGLPIRWPSHVRISHTEFDWEGDDRVGFRVQARLPDGPTGTWFVVREGRYRIQAVESAPGLLGAQALDWIERGREGAARRWLTWASELDVDRTPAFRSLFPGAVAPGDAPLAWAAAALAPADPRAPDILERAVTRAPDALKGTIYEALVRAYASRGQTDRQIDAARAWLEHEPGSTIGHRWVFSGLIAQGRLQDAEEWARARRPEIGFDPVTARELAEVASSQGRYRDAEFHLRDVMDRGFGTVETYNQLAWVRLLRGVSMPEDLDLMEKALDESPSPHPAATHTLACHLVEQGRLKRALELIRDRRARLRGLERDDWFVIGRVLEHAGLLEDARAAYDRVGEPDQSPSVDTWRLVERRLRVMDEEGAMGSESTEASGE